MKSNATLTASVKTHKDGSLELLSPAVGLWRGAPVAGSLIRPGFSLGAIEVLGKLHPLVAPKNAIGAVEERSEDRARLPVEFNQVLLRLDPQITGAGLEESAQQAQQGNAEGLVFTAPMSGRFYLRPSPDKPLFLKPGDEVETGQTVCLLEVMKTFNRVGYGGEDLPERAKVKSILPSDGDDLSAGQPILELIELE